MTTDYSIYLEHLKGRRYDEVRKEPVLSDGFFEYDYPDPIKYALESMYEIDPSYSYKLFSEVRKTQDFLTEKLAKSGIRVDARYQGAHNCDAHIQLLGDLELVLILKRHTAAPARDVQQLASAIMDILTSSHSYNKVDYSDRNRIYVQTKKPACDISILPAIWVDSKSYKETGLEINRGICEFNFLKKTKKVHLSFLNMARVNARDRDLDGNLKYLLRLLRSLCKDSEHEINLGFDELSGILYNIPEKYFKVDKDRILSILPVISVQLKKLILSDKYRMKMLAPNQKEYLFGKRPVKRDLLYLKKEVDLLTKSCMRALKEFEMTLKSDLEYFED
jgi:hypothetical protein